MGAWEDKQFYMLSCLCLSWLWAWYLDLDLALDLETNVLLGILILTYALTLFWVGEMGGGGCYAYVFKEIVCLCSFKGVYRVSIFYYAWSRSKVNCGVNLL